MSAALAIFPVFSVTLPFFALVLCGYLATRSGTLPAMAIGGLNTFVLYFALPCMLYRFGAGTPIAQLLDPAVALVYLLCTLLLAAGTIALARRARMDWNNTAFAALVALFPNTGFMGVPLLLALLGAHSTGPVMVVLVMDMVLTSSLCIALSRLDSTGGVGAALRKAARGMASNPMPWAIVLGAAASGLQWQLPEPVERTLAMLAAAASPVALFTIGAVLARPQTSATHARPYVPLVLVKLVLHPLLLWCLGRAALALGLPLSPMALSAIVLVAALPSASNVSMLAERFGAHGERVARVILLSTVLAFFSFPLAVVLWG